MPKLAMLPYKKIALLSILNPQTIFFYKMELSNFPPDWLFRRLVEIIIHSKAKQEEGAALHQPCEFVQAGHAPSRRSFRQSLTRTHAELDSSLHRTNTGKAKIKMESPYTAPREATPILVQNKQNSNETKNTLLQSKLLFCLSSVCSFNSYVSKDVVQHQSCTNKIRHFSQASIDGPAGRQMTGDWNCR